jgi:hypothetical protein
MASNPETKSKSQAKTGETRRDRLAAELRSNLRKRKARARNIERLQNAKHDTDKAQE